MPGRYSFPRANGKRLSGNLNSLNPIRQHCHSLFLGAAEFLMGNGVAWSLRPFQYVLYSAGMVPDVHLRGSCFVILSSSPK
jgi:hypothetical protein